MNTRIVLMGVMMVIGLSSFAQQATTGIVKLRGTRLTYPLVNKWIEEFKKERPDIQVSIAPKAPEDSIDFSIASYEIEPADLTNNRVNVVVTRYIQLPVANSERPGLTELKAKGVTDKNLKDLFFTPRRI